MPAEGRFGRIIDNFGLNCSDCRHVEISVSMVRVIYL